MEKKTLVYWAKYNQFYRIIEVDSDSKVVKMVVAKNKRDRTITRDMIVRVELCPEWQFICMKNQYITAEENFVNSMRVSKEFNRKINELIDFKRNGLVDSEMAMNELNRIFHQGFKNVKSEQDRRFRNKVKTLYEELMTEQTKNDNKRSYDQRVPAEIIAIAKDKGLLIERNDDYITKKGSRVKPTKNELIAIRGQKPCGYLIRDTNKKAIAGFGYKFTSKQVVEFVQKYTPYINEKEKFEIMKKKYEEFKHVVDAETGVVYRVIFNRHSDNTLIMVKTEKKFAKNTMDDVRNAGYNIEIKEFKRKETPFEWFYRMSQSNRIADKRTAAKFDSIEGIQEMSIVIDVLKKMLETETDSVVLSNAKDSLQRLGEIEKEEITAPVSKEEQKQKIISATTYEELIECLDGKLTNKKQRRLEEREVATELPLEIIKKVKMLGSNVCVVKAVNKGFNIARYPADRIFYTVNQLEKWLDNELNKVA